MTEILSDRDSDATDHWGMHVLVQQCESTRASYPIDISIKLSQSKVQSSKPSLRGDTDHISSDSVRPDRQGQLHSGS